MDYGVKVNYKDIDAEKFPEIFREKFYRTSRWSATDMVVIQAPDGKKYRYFLEYGLTEYQDYCGIDRYPDAQWPSGDLDLEEVELYEKTVVDYRPVQ